MTSEQLRVTALVAADFVRAETPATILALLGCVEALQVIVRDAELNVSTVFEPSLDKARAALKKLGEL